MSEPPPIPPEAYSIDPDRQCGVLKSDGNRCSVRLNCLLHTEVEKAAIPRSKEYKQLLKLQPPSLALDFRLRLGVPRLPPSGLLAWISDPNVHCGVPLARSAGLPCQAGIAACTEHSLEQMSLVPGRCASVDELRRVLQANRDLAGQTKSTFDADVHCGVSRPDGKLCTRRLRCSDHKISDKQAVPRNTGFQGRFFDLLGLQLALLPAFESLLYTENSEVAKGTVDTDVQCGVLHKRRRPCPNALNCSVHTTKQKLKVPRSAELETLIRRQYPMSAVTDRYCGVLLPDSERCGNDFGCGLHTNTEKEQVLRHAQLKVLTAQELPHGLATDLVDRGDDLDSAIQRYHRTDMATADITADRARGECFEASVHDIAAENLNSLRQVFYEPIAETPSRSINHLLSGEKLRTLESKTWVGSGGQHHFAFAPDASDLRLVNSRNLLYFQQACKKHCCVLSAAQTDFALDDNKAEDLRKRLENLLERLPIDLYRMSNGLKHWMFHSAVFAPALEGIESATRIPFRFGQIVIEGKPYIVLDIRLYGVHKDEREDRGYTAPILIPLSGAINKVPVPHTANVQAFHFKGLEVGQEWLEPKLSKEEQQHIIDVASYIVATTHLVPMDEANLRWYVETVLSEMFKIKFLVQPASTPLTSMDIVDFNAATGRVLAQHPLLDLPDIQTIPTEQACLLVAQCVKTRFLLTRDWLVSWSDAANLGDMLLQFPNEVLRSSCECSQEESKSEVHLCLVCGTPTACYGLHWITLLGHDTRACDRCVDLTGSEKVAELGPEPARTEPARTEPARTEPARTETATRPTATFRPVKMGLYDALRREYVLMGKNVRHPQFEREKDAMYDTIRSSSHSQGDQDYEDGYFRTLVNTASDKLMRPSPEATTPLVFEEGTPRIHVLGNMTITRWYANTLCGTFPSIVLAILHRLDASTSEVERSELMERLDNLCLIRRQIPWSTEDRLKVPFDAEVAADLAAQHQSGIASLDACLRIQNPWRIGSRVATNVQSARVDTLPGIDQVRQFVADLEATSGRPFVRINGVPYPFHGGPRPLSWSWTLFYRNMNVRLKTLLRRCNRRHKTDCTKDQLLCAVLYLLHMGREAQPTQLLDVPVCIYNRHPASMSIGKADHKKGMVAGFKSGTTVTLANLDLKLLNLCIEPWLCNTAKKDKDDQVDLIRQDFRSNLNIESSKHWPAELPPLDERVSRRCIRDALISTEDSLGDGPDGEVGVGENVDVGEDTGDMPPHHLTSTPKVNMSNLGQTCYMSTVLETLHNMEEVRGFVADKDNFHFKAQTGMTDSELFSSSMTTFPSQAIQEAREARAAHLTVLIDDLRRLFEDLDLATSRLPAQATHDILSAVQLIDERWQNKSNESAQLLNTFIHSIVAASDTSDASARGLRAAAASTRNALDLPHIAVDATTTWELWCAEGHLTPLVDKLYSQIVTEIPCSDCHSVSRSFEHTFVSYLDFPQVESETPFTLDEILDTFFQESISDGFSCETAVNHTRSFVKHRRICKGAEYICFAMTRGAEGEMQIEKNVVFPEKIDLGRHMDTQRLPSNTLGDVRGKVFAPIKEEQYELVAVNNWLGRHYIGYILIDGSWVMFNDFHPSTSKKSPMTAWAEGELLHYGIYKRCHPQADNPVPSAANVRHGGDDDLGFTATGDGSTREETMGAQHVRATPKRNQRITSDTGSPNYSPTAPVFSPITPRVRQRPLSSGTGIASKSPRGSLHGDVSASRHDDQLATREADLQTREAALKAGETRVAEQATALRRKEEAGDADLKTREVSLREKELAAREARLAEDKLRIEDMRVREARLAGLQEKEMTRREARLADEEVRDARLAAREARLADQETAMQETLKTREAELEARHKKRTQEMQDERDSVLSNARAQRGAIMQSIRDLRTSLRDRSAAYQGELAGIATQIGSATAQIEALQSSVEGLRLQRDNIASRYQADKAQMEEAIDKLQEKITALLE
jgi:ubiquitin C-terminal hydrolase